MAQRGTTVEEPEGVHSAGINEFPEEEPGTRVVNETDESDSETWIWDGEQWVKAE